MENCKIVQLAILQQAQDRVLLSRAAMEEPKVVMQCPECKARTLTDVIVGVALKAPLPCKRCGTR